jgi:hypothetical protein
VPVEPDADDLAARAAVGNLHPAVTDSLVQDAPEAPHLAAREAPAAARHHRVAHEAAGPVCVPVESSSVGKLVSHQSGGDPEGSAAPRILDRALR